MPLTAAGATHQGRRHTNEDAWLFDPGLGLLLVADGMGGHNAGEVASAMAVSCIRDYLDASGGEATRARLSDAVSHANSRILAAAAVGTGQAGMGTTVVAVLVAGGRALYTGVGDSRLYHWRDGRLQQLTRDDSWLVAMFGDEEAELEGRESHPMRHVLTRVVGLRADLEPDVSECGFEPGDWLLLCSDGVHGSIPHAVMAELVAGSPSPQDLVRNVVAMAIARGASDNATAVAARLD